MSKHFLYLMAVLLCLQPVVASEVPEMVEQVLPTGLRIVAMENPGSDTVSVNVFISAGSLDESPDTAGLAHFYEHMFFRGCLLYTSPSPRDRTRSRMPSSA